MSTIVVGIDRSSASRAALDWAARHASQRHASLLVAHVVDDEWGADGDEMRAAEQELTENVAALSESVPGLDVEALLVAGNPSVELASLASRADLLVVGTHKTGFVQGHVFGSRALRLAAASDVPVAVIPERATGARRGIVVGIDSSAASDAAVRFGAAEAERTGEELILLLATGTAGSVHGTERAERGPEVVARALRIAEATHPEVGVRVRTVRRAPSPAIVEVAGRARLLVVGSSRRHCHGAGALGPVAHDVLLNIAAPTVVVHPLDLAVPAARV